LLFNTFSGFSLIRYPVKFLFLSTFIIAVLSAYGFDALREYKGKPNWFYSLILILGAAMLAFSLAGYLAPDWFYKITRPLFAEEIRAGFEPQLRLMSMRNIVNLGISGMFFLIAGAILLFTGKKEKILILFLPFLLLDIYLANYDLNFSMNSKDFQVESPNINLLMKDKGEFRVLASPELLKRQEYETSDESLDYRSALISIRDRVAANQNILYKIESAQIYESIHGADQETILNNLYAVNNARGLPLLDLLNIKYLLTAHPFINPAFRLLSKRDELIKSGSIFLYQNQNVRPRRFEISSYEVFADRKKLLAHMFSGGYDPKKKLLFEEEPEKCDRFLFVSESFYPGWRAFVDGREAKIYRANYMFRAVPLPSGAHTVKFVYDPVSLKAGALVSLITILGLIGFALYPVMRENKRS
jgi:uncharacterized membrane protein YfhO